MGKFKRRKLLRLIIDSVLNLLVHDMEETCTEREREREMVLG